MSNGRIFLVGIGPGAAEQMSARARRAIAESEVVIGYAKYLDLISDLLVGKEVVRKGMTQEVERCTVACAQAQAGRSVALVSSGDIGVYGMAGLAYEVLFESGWTSDDDIRVEVVPGITALSACASLVGAPLSHDFCAISLSDLLTPWPVIARRLEAAARGDFVVALYNPRSGRRREQLVQARAILLRHRQPSTPVAIVDAAYRKRQTTRVSTLEGMLACEIGMLSTVLIGNSSTYSRAGLMITPRGYAHKYDTLSGEIKEGERSGRSLSLGLDGWKTCVRRQLRERPNPSLTQIARHLDAPMGEIFSAIAEAGTHDDVGGYAATAITPGREAEVLDETRGWGRLRIAVTSGTGTACEFVIDGQELIHRRDRLSLEKVQVRLEVDRSAIHRGWFLAHADHWRGLQFVDTSDNSLVAIALEKQHGRFDPEALAHYESAHRRFGVTKHRP